MSKGTAKLHELLAVEANLRGQSEATRKDLRNTFDKKRTHFQEKVVTFVSNQEGVVPVVEEQLGLQTTIKKELVWIGAKIVAAIDCAFQIDVANRNAQADIVLDDGTTLLLGVPATALLQLEKRVKEIQELAADIPTLDPARGFAEDPARGEGIYQARDTVKTRTTKKEDFIVVVQPTKEHPAQVQKVVKDVPTGEIQTQEWSSLITVSDKGDILDRLEALLRAVKAARSRANETTVSVVDFQIGQKLLDYAFNGKK